MRNRSGNVVDVQRRANAWKSNIDANIHRDRRAVSCGRDRWGRGAPNEDNGIIVEWRVVRSYDSDVSGLMVNAVVQSMLSSKFLTFQHHILNILLHSDTGIHESGIEQDAKRKRVDEVA